MFCGGGEHIGSGSDGAGLGPSTISSQLKAAGLMGAVWSVDRTVGDGDQHLIREKGNCYFSHQVLKTVG